MLRVELIWYMQEIATTMQSERKSGGGKALSFATNAHRLAGNALS